MVQPGWQNQFDSTASVQPVRLLTGRQFAIIQQDKFTIYIDSPYANAFDIDQFIRVFEHTICVPVSYDRFGFALAYTF